MPLLLLPSPEGVHERDREEIKVSGVCMRESECVDRPFHEASQPFSASQSGPL